MEQLNRIELRGIVGNARVTETGGSRLVRMTLVTSFAYRSKDRDCIIESTWHQLYAFEGEHVRDVDTIRKGDKIHVVGRLVNRRVLTESGEERSCTEVMVHRLERIAEKEPLQCEFQ